MGEGGEGDRAYTPLSRAAIVICSDPDDYMAQIISKAEEPKKKAVRIRLGRNKQGRRFIK